MEKRKAGQSERGWEGWRLEEGLKTKHVGWGLAEKVTVEPCVCLGSHLCKDIQCVWRSMNIKKSERM